MPSRSESYFQRRSFLSVNMVTQNQLDQEEKTYLDAGPHAAFRGGEFQSVLLETNDKGELDRRV